MSHVTLLNKALKAHGGSLTAFAAEVLGRHVSTVSRWRNGHKAIPATVVTRLKTYLLSTTEGQ